MTTPLIATSMFVLICIKDGSSGPAALFGTGDQLTYGDTFQDAIGILADKLEERGATLRGAWPVEGYEHTASAAQRGDRFVGLALDLDDQPDLHEARIERWVEQLVEEFGLTTGAREAVAAAAS